MRYSYVFISALVGVGIGLGLAKIFYPVPPPQTCSEVKNETSTKTSQAMSPTPAPPAEKNISAPAEKLNPPEFHPTAPKILETNDQGEVYVRWVEAPLAKSYQLLIEDRGGGVIRKQKTTRTFYYLRELPVPDGKISAEYLISLTSIGEDGQMTEPGEKRTLRVKAQSAIIAPKVQEIRVEN